MNLNFDNGSTSYPKPAEVAERMAYHLTKIGGTYGRSAYARVIESSREVEACRDLLSNLIGCSNSENLIFSFNATTALNTLIVGSLERGDHVLISALEHNAVMRPLENLRVNHGIEYSVLPSLPDGTVALDKISDKIKANTSLVIINHSSNVNGVVQPIAKIKSEIGKTFNANILPIRKK